MGVKPILQSEAAECGLACLAMVVNHYGHCATLRELRQRYPQTLKGAHLGQLIEMAAHLGLSARPLRLDIEAVRQLTLPAILHWDLGHFVVLCKVRRDAYVIVDPSVGRMTISAAEFDRRFSGVALELAPDQGFTKRKPPPAVTLSQVMGSTEGLWRSALLVLGLSLGLQALMLSTPLYMQWVLDQVLVTADHDLMTLLGIGFLALVLTQATLHLLRGWFVVALSASFFAQWAGNVAAHLLRLPLGFFQARHLGDITSRMESVRTIQRTLSAHFVETVVDGALVVVTLAMMLFYSVRLTLLALCAVALYLLLRLVLFRAMESASERQLVAESRQQSHLLESLRGIQSVKVLGIVLPRSLGFRERLSESTHWQVRVARMQTAFASANQLIFGVERVLAIWWAASLAMDARFSVGMLVAFLAYKDQFAQRSASLIERWLDLRMLRLHADRVGDIVLSPAETPRVRFLPTESAATAAPGIRVRGLSFRYGPNDPWILKSVDFDIRPGESVAITGPSGCGKSTLLKLLLGLLPPCEGRIEIDGVDITAGDGHLVECGIGVVMQDDMLFAGSIAENIALGSERMNFEQVEHAARLAAVHDDILRLPMGYQSLIGDMGSTLSGGQKQRVLLARALYRSPRLLCLDEATSHLDLAREQVVNDAVRALAITRVIVAHRPETIASAQRVLHMDGAGGIQDARHPGRGLRPEAASELPQVASIGG